MTTRGELLRQAAALRNAYRPCIRCGSPVAKEALRHLIGLRGNGILEFESGAIVTKHGAVYCQTCAPTVRICATCGCTDEDGCPSGCCWLTETPIAGVLDLCSSCDAEASRDRFAAEILGKFDAHLGTKEPGE